MTGSVFPSYTRHQIEIPPSMGYCEAAFSRTSKEEGTYMTIKEKLEQKQRLLADQSKQLHEYTESSRHVDRELKALHKALTSGKPVDTDNIGKRIVAIAEEVKTHHTRLQDLNILRETLFEVSPEDKRFALKEYPIPSPFLKFTFETDLRVSSMFTVFTDEETEYQFTRITGGAFDEEITQYGHIWFVETMFSDTFDDDIAFIVMNAFFWILYFMGDTWLPVRSYAIEMLKLFPKAILEQYPIPEDFIEAFSRFTRRILASRGICLLKARPTPDEGKKGLYAIKATGAFKHLLEPTRDARKKTLASIPE
ncbi:MAG: hypothetical protein JEY71_17740 [Sphaerochaeta sp.]|nr:hypothetical protein [Sphaerochaeta sp.]